MPQQQVDAARKCCELRLKMYSTFFLAEPHQLLPEFPGWRPPLSQPVTRVVTNPFTQKQQTITTCDPDISDFDVEQSKQPSKRKWFTGLLSMFGFSSQSKYRVVVIDGDYETYLERRIPKFVQSQLHWCSKNLCSIDLDSLVAGVTSATDCKLDTALYAHPSLGCFIEKFPDAFVARLKLANDAANLVFAKQWASAMSTTQHTHNQSGERVSEDWTVDDALKLVRSIANLVQLHTEGQSLYLLIEP